MVVNEYSKLLRFLCLSQRNFNEVHPIIVEALKKKHQDSSAGNYEYPHFLTIISSDI